jgi:hypothetical protein
LQLYFANWRNPVPNQLRKKLAVTALCKLVQPCSKLVAQKAELLELLR